MNARMTRPPTVPPTMRIVFVLEPLLDWVADSAATVEVAVEDVDESVVGVDVVSVGRTVGTGVELLKVDVSCVMVAIRAAISVDDADGV
jgi:hypothetical protein